MFRWFSYMLVMGWAAFVAFVILGFSNPKIVAGLIPSPAIYTTLAVWLLLLIVASVTYGVVVVYRIGMRPPK